MCLGMFLLRFILYGTLCASWTFSFSLLGKFPITISSTFFWYSFFFPSCSGTPIIRMLVHLIWFQMSLRLSDWTELSVLLSHLLHPWVWISPHSHSSAYHLTGVSLIFYFGYLFMPAPAKHSPWNWPWTWGIYLWPLQKNAKEQNGCLRRPYRPK